MTMKNAKLTAALLAVLLSIAMLLTACKGSDTPSGNESTGGSTATPTTSETATPEVTESATTPEASETPTTGNAPTWADPSTYDTEKKPFVDEWIEKANGKISIDIDCVITQAFEKYGEYFNENITPESVRTAVAMIIAATPKLTTAENISALPTNSVQKANDFLAEKGKAKLDITDPTQNIAALAIAASLFYEPNVGNLNMPVMDLAVAFGSAYSGEMEANSRLVGTFNSCYYLPIE
jgi:hypothetical protein